MVHAGFEGRAMKIQFCAIILAAVGVGACAPTTTGSTGASVVLPESVVAMAAPNQDLRSVVLKPEDGCYWYRHVGVVETTMLPLRNKAGRPICTRADSAVS